MIHRRTSRLNHVALTLLGIVLLAASAFLLVRHFDLVHRLPKSDPLYTRAQARWIHSHDWVWIVVAAVAVVVGLATLRWLLVQQRLDRVRTLPLDTDGDEHGRTTIAGSVLTDAVEDDLVGYPGVARARVLLTGTRARPELVVRLTTQPAADLVTVRRLIVDEALPAVRQALDVPDIPVQLHLGVAGREREERVVV